MFGYFFETFEENEENKKKANKKYVFFLIFNLTVFFPNFPQYLFLMKSFVNIF